MPKREKLQIRLPTDDEPNPWDSRTPLKQLAPRWFWDAKWWISLIAIALAVTVAHYLIQHH